MKPPFPSQVCAAALSYASVAYLSRDDIFGILAEPSFAHERTVVAKASRFYRMKALLTRAAQDILKTHPLQRVGRKRYSIGTTTKARRTTVQIGTKTIKKNEKLMNRASVRFSAGDDGSVQLQTGVQPPGAPIATPQPPPPASQASPGTRGSFDATRSDSVLSLSSPASSPRRASDPAPRAVPPTVDKDLKDLKEAVEELKALVKFSLQDQPRGDDRAHGTAHVGPRGVPRRARLSRPSDRLVELARVRRHAHEARHAARELREGGDEPVAKLPRVAPQRAQPAERHLLEGDDGVAGGQRVKGV